jgi:hypothetical protein
MRQEYAEASWIEVATALLTMGIVVFLLFV